MLSITYESAPHLRGLKYEEIPLAIRKQDINIFLGELWDEFRSSIGPIACYHDYYQTDNPEVYHYSVHWAHKDIPFEALIIFSNHASKGLTGVSIVAVSFDTKIPDSEWQENIKTAIVRTRAGFNNDSNRPISGYASAPIKTSNKLHGCYLLNESDIVFLSSQNEGDRVVFPVFSKNETDRGVEAQNKIVDLLAIVSTITQQLFDIDPERKWRFLLPADFYALKNTISTNGEYVTDHGHFKAGYAKGETIYIGQRCDEIIESDDCLINDKQCLPERADKLIKMVTEDIKYLQSCRRFWEGLKIRSEFNMSPMAIYSISYELIAFVASIEALIEAGKKTTEIVCDGCGNLIYKEDWTISKKFKELIADLSGLAPALPAVFSKIYEDRSKFVHTGINLHSFGAHRQGRPSILKGKVMESALPAYYHNMHDFTGYIIRRFLYRKLNTSLPE